MPGSRADRGQKADRARVEVDERSTIFPAVGRTSDARERLISAAIDLVWPQGYAAVGVDAICERADVRKGSFYHFFASKDDLMVAALDANWRERRAILDGVFSPEVPPLARLLRYFDHVYKRQVELRRRYGRTLGCFYGSVGTECVERCPEVASKVQEILAGYARYLETAIHDAQERGAVRPGDPKKKAAMLFACIEGVLGQARIHDDPSIVRQLKTIGFELLGVEHREDVPVADADPNG